MIQILRFSKLKTYYVTYYVKTNATNSLFCSFKIFEFIQNYQKIISFKFSQQTKYIKNNYQTYSVDV